MWPSEVLLYLLRLPRLGRGAGGSRVGSGGCSFPALEIAVPEPAEGGFGTLGVRWGSRDLKKPILAWARSMLLSRLSLYPNLKVCLWQRPRSRCTDLASCRGHLERVPQGKGCTDSVSRAAGAFCDWRPLLSTPEGLAPSARAFLGSELLSSGAGGRRVTKPSLACQWVEVGRGHWVRGNG